MAALIAAGCAPEEVCPSDSVRDGDRCRALPVDVVFPEDTPGVVLTDIPSGEDATTGETEDGNGAVEDTAAPDSDERENTDSDDARPPPDEGREPDDASEEDTR